MSNDYDCIVVGSGHAGSCAAISAIQSGCSKVLMVDKCPPEWAGGNGYFTAGAHRTVHGGLADILGLVSNVPSEKAAQIDLEPYSIEQFTDDMQRLSRGRSDPVLVDTLVKESRTAIQWLKDFIGVDFTMSFNRQAYEIGGRQVFWGGMALSVRDGGKGLIYSHSKALEKLGVERRFGVGAVALVLGQNGVVGLKVHDSLQQDRTQESIIRTQSVILAAGGFEANKEMRREYLGEGWENASVRGTPYNTGDGFEIASLAGAKRIGHWAGCHSTCWDANANPEQGERGLTNQFTKSGYPLGIMVNCDGMRFVDEGEDFRNYTYAKFGRAILMQPGGFVFQVWDGKVISKLREEEYGDGVVDKVVAGNLAELADQLESRGMNPGARKQFLETMASYNDAVRAYEVENVSNVWDPAIKDGKSTLGLDLPKSNWALSIDEAPFMAVKVACGITFTFGGLLINPVNASVISENGEEIPGLYCTGEMVGGLFYENYPGGSGLTAGAVFGRKAGRSAGKRSRVTST